MRKILQNQRGVIDIVLIVVVFVLAAGLGGYVYYRQQQNNKAYNSAGNGSTVSKHVATKKKSQTPAIDPTASWTAYTNTNGHYSLKYPVSWKTTTCDASKSTVYLGPTSDDLAKCNSDFVGQMFVAEYEDGTTATSLLNSSAEPTFTKQSEVSVVINGVTGTRVVNKVAQENPSLAIGTIQIEYAFQSGKRVYYAVYNQAVTGATSKDVSADFDTMVKSTLKFN